MRILILIVFSLPFLALTSCSSKKKMILSPSTGFEGDYSLIIDEVITYGKEHMSYAFRGCTKIKSTAHLDEDYYCQFSIWKRFWNKFATEDRIIPDSSFLFDKINHLLELNLDESLIDHCIEVVDGQDSDHFLTSSLPKNTLMFSPLIPTNSPNFYLLWVHITSDRDPPEMAFTILREGDLYKVINGSWDDQCF